jgi:hypothetical protein
MWSAGTKPQKADGFFEVEITKGKKRKKKDGMTQETIPFGLARHACIDEFFVLATVYSCVLEFSGSVFSIANAFGVVWFVSLSMATLLVQQ